MFILWGNNAREKKKFITNPKHLIIESEKKEAPSNYQFYSKFLGNINMFMTPELEKIFDNYSSELNGYFNK